MAQVNRRGGLLGALMLTNRQLKIAVALAVVLVLSAIAGGSGGVSLLGTGFGTVFLVWAIVMVARAVKYGASWARR